ncbi:MAG: hypothetical protein RhofKO_41890 [Rhodothermales bacterium]
MATANTAGTQRMPTHSIPLFATFCFVLMMLTLYYIAAGVANATLTPDKLAYLPFF